MLLKTASKVSPTPHFGVFLGPFWGYFVSNMVTWSSYDPIWDPKWGQFEPILTLIRIPVRARAYNDLYQHPGCVKNSIKIGSILMLVLTAPESGSHGSRFDAGFNTVHFEGQNGP